MSGASCQTGSIVQWTPPKKTLAYGEGFFLSPQASGFAEAWVIHRRGLMNPLRGFRGVLGIARLLQEIARQVELAADLGRKGGVIENNVLRPEVLQPDADLVAALRHSRQLVQEIRNG